jgi:predicted ATPase/transcriptional regulator with XRE-family HTH domain
MTPQNDKGTIFIGEDDFPLFFGKWIKRRRKSLDMTQDQLAKRVCCSVHTIRKIEMGERRPSKQLAELLANLFGIPSDQLPTFLKAARGELSVESLRSLTHDPVYQPARAFIPLPGYLPRSLTPFIGRVPEISAVGELLQDSQCSLLTIAGPGGIGKTRLAVEAAHRSKDLYPDGVWFVSLAPLNSPSLIVPTIAEALNYKFQDPTNPKDQLIRYLRTKMALLVLDNAEHLLEGVDVFAEILEGCPQVKLLVTSRERLNLLSEWVFEIQGLPLPPGDQVEQFEAYSSVALFLQSARRVLTGFEIREAERIWVLRICQAMEGMPLGIELSAAWLGLLSCEEIAKEIEKNLDFLSVSMRDLPERHRSLRATLDHSWRLLNDEERSVLCRLSVFQGSFSREAVQAICGASLGILSSLRNKSLLYQTDQGFYVLHKVIRQYAGLKLSENPDLDEQVKDQHALYYVQCLSEWEKALKSPRQVEIINQMAQVIDNLSRGWQHMIITCRSRTGKSNRFPVDLLHDSLFSLSLFYEERGRSWEAIELFKESVETLRAAKAEYEATEDRICFLSVLGLINAHLGKHLIFVLKVEEAREYLEEALRLLDQSQSRVEKAQAQLMISEIDYIQGQVQKSAAGRVQSREVFREEGENWWYLLSTIELASTYIVEGKYGESKELFQEGFRLIQSGDLRQELRLRYGYASLLFILNDFARAEQMMHENLQLSHQLGNDRLTAYIFYDLGRLALATQRIEQAEEHLQKSMNLLSKFGESHELGRVQLYFGKCFAARSDLPAARDQFRQVIKIGVAMDMFYYVYWGLVNIARTYLEEGQTGKALEISLSLRGCPVELERIQDDRDRLLADLQAALPAGQIEAVLQQVDGDISPDQAKAAVQTYVQEHEIGSPFNLLPAL